ncbi:MAG TPA: M48 family metalloprotease [Gemmatimonadaceae bacterium]|nr:M48 family metalloprotease [Gemmatimonadaceae bacterium]
MSSVSKINRSIARWTFLLPVVAACATNPVTGKPELALVSEQQEIQMGQQGAQQVAQEVGLVKDQALQNYVQSVGAAIAAKSERPNLPWTFRAVDDPSPNAFALPGGYIFVTRGLLDLMNNEAELASVLGHEIGHVTARHSVHQMSQQQLAQLALGIGAILSPTVAQLGGVASQGLGLLFLKYTRDDERQADDLGFRYALNQGYDVRYMDDVFRSLQRLAESSNQSPLPNWLQTHPGEAERIQAIDQKLAQLQPNQLANAKVNASQYLQRINGLVYGADPRNGFFQGNTFYHPDLRFQISMPSGWQGQNLSQAVIAVSPQQDAVIQLTLAQGSSPEAAARAFLSQQGIQAGQASQQTVNGVPAVASQFQAQTEQGVIQGLAAFFTYNGATYQVIGYAPAQRYGAYDAAFRQSLGSFAPVTDSRVLNVQPRKLNVVTLSQQMTLAEFTQRNPSTVPLAELAIVNQVEDPNKPLPAGTAVKQVTGGTRAS